MIADAHLVFYDIRTYRHQEESTVMKETSTQRIHRLIQEKNIRALLVETEQLLVIYLNGDDAIDLEPIVSAQSVLHQAIELFPSQEDQDKEFPITIVTRID